MTPIHGVFFCFNDLLTAVSDARGALSCRTNTNVFLKSNSCMDSVVATNACLGILSDEVSPLSILELQLVPETRTEDVVDRCSSEANTFDSNKVTVENPREYSALTSLYGKNGLLDQRGTFEDKIGNSVNSSQSPIATEDNVTETLSELHGFSNNLKPVPVDIWENLSTDDLCQWFDPSPEDSTCGTVTALDNTVSQTIEFNPTYSSPVGRDVLSGIPVNSDTFASMHISDSTKLDFGFVEASERLGNILTPVVNAATDSGLSECISKLNNIGRQNGTRKGLFSELGIEDFLNGAANSNSLDRSDRLWTNKRQRTDYSPAAVDLMQPVSTFGKTNRFVHKQGIFPNQSVKNGKAVVPSQPQKPEELTKTTRKIQDRIKELRGIIPHGGKRSIDSLLGRTIKYMLFLQSITKYADKLQEDNLKSGRGSTWALEVGGQTMVCPIIVEDMSSPGQMLIEMLLCEGQGFLLEIVDIIRTFGLNILKGKMEIREGKIWAIFIVEAKIHVTRVDVFWFLVQLVEQTNSPGMDSDSANKPSDSLGSYPDPRREMPLAIAMNGRWRISLCFPWNRINNRIFIDR